jgi:hypothetical protein
MPGLQAVGVVYVMPAFLCGIAEVSQDVEVSAATTVDEPGNAGEVALG